MSEYPQPRLWVGPIAGTDPDQTSHVHSRLWDLEPQEVQERPMRIFTHEGKQLPTDFPADQLRLSQVKPGQVFKYVRGKDHNIYIMGHHSLCFLLSQSTVFSDQTFGAAGDAPVVIFPDARMDLGTPVSSAKALEELTGQPVPEHDSEDIWPIEDEDGSSY